MHHAVFARITLGIVALLGAAALSFAWFRTRAGEVEGGAVGPGAAVALPAAEADPREAYRRHCARCHELEDLAAALAAAPDPGEAVLALVEFLGDHGASTPREDLAIVRWIHAESRRMEPDR